MLHEKTTGIRIVHWLALLAVVALAALLSVQAPTTRAQDDPVDAELVTESSSSEETDEELESALANAADGAADPQLESINVFDLLVSGGFFMLPILLMSLLVVTVSIERFIGLRRARVLPQGLVQALGQMGGPQGGFDPRQAYRVCQQYPSAASTVIRAMLLKIGRPHSEVEHTVTEASEREAARLYANVRWLNLAAAVTPLLGLLGTVWGMIQAFHETTQLVPGQNRADSLATGIYVALVTTLSGLSVAIPAAIISHYFEGRIQALFHQIDELLFSLMPQIERFEGRVRFSRNVDQRDGNPRESTLEPPVQEAPARK